LFIIEFLMIVNGNIQKLPAREAVETRFGLKTGGTA
jgi:hypothetical protein